jgi:uncharacterized phiE125 gp8 family phage protein
MRGGQHEIARQRRPRAEAAARTGDHDELPTHRRAFGIGGAADQRRGRGDRSKQRGESEEGGACRHPRDQRCHNVNVNGADGMSSILLSPPAVEPITLAEAKLFLRVAHSDDDVLITALIVAARAQVEAQTRRALITQRWRLLRDRWPADGRIAVVPVPLIAIVAARVRDTDGVAHDVALDAFVADAAAAPAVIAFAPWSLAAPGQAVAGIELDVDLGYGAAAADVPEPLRLAIRLLLAHWYENRGVATVGETVAPLPANVAALIAPYRVLSL